MGSVVVSSVAAFFVGAIAGELLPPPWRTPCGRVLAWLALGVATTAFFFVLER
jgi:hypothetical protein